MSTQATSPQSYHHSMPPYGSDPSAAPSSSAAPPTPQQPQLPVPVDNLTPASARHLQQAMAAREAALTSAHSQQPPLPSLSTSSLYPGAPSDSASSAAAAANLPDTSGGPQYHLTSAPPVDDAGLTPSQIAARKLKATLPPDVAELIPDELPSGIDPDTLRFMSHAQLRLAFKQPQKVRRSAAELNANEKWICPNKPCGAMYKQTSSKSIKKHLEVCPHRNAPGNTVQSAQALLNVNGPQHYTLQPPPPGQQQQQLPQLPTYDAPPPTDTSSSSGFQQQQQPPQQYNYNSEHQQHQQQQHQQQQHQPQQQQQQQQQHPSSPHTSEAVMNAATSVSEPVIAPPTEDVSDVAALPDSKKRRLSENGNAAPLETPQPQTTAATNVTHSPNSNGNVRRDSVNERTRSTDSKFVDDDSLLPSEPTSADASASRAKRPRRRGSKPEDNNDNALEALLSLQAVASTDDVSSPTKASEPA